MRGLSALASCRLCELIHFISEHYWADRTENLIVAVMRQRAGWMLSSAVHDACSFSLLFPTNCISLSMLRPYSGGSLFRQMQANCAPRWHFIVRGCTWIFTVLSLVCFPQCFQWLKYTFLPESASDLLLTLWHQAAYKQWTGTSWQSVRQLMGIKPCDLLFSPQNPLTSHFHLVFVSLRGPLLNLVSS